MNCTPFVNKCKIIWFYNKCWGQEMKTDPNIYITEPQKTEQAVTLAPFFGEYYFLMNGLFIAPLPWRTVWQKSMDCIFNEKSASSFSPLPQLENAICLFHSRSQSELHSAFAFRLYEIHLPHKIFWRAYSPEKPKA